MKFNDKDLKPNKLLNYALFSRLHVSLFLQYSVKLLAISSLIRGRNFETNFKQKNFECK
jgi:hypothetical protein